MKRIYEICQLKNRNKKWNSISYYVRYFYEYGCFMVVWDSTSEWNKRWVLRFLENTKILAADLSHPHWLTGRQTSLIIYLVFYVMFCRSLFDLFLLSIVLSVFLQFTDFDYSFGIFKHFFLQRKGASTRCIG
jgi:hypothetical protein